MDEESTRVVEALERAAKALERAAEAQEHLNALAAAQAQETPEEVLREEDLFDPPACPHCGTLDFHTRVKQGSEGRLSEFVLATPCGTCGGDVYAMPVGWRIVGDVESARRMLSAPGGLMKGAGE